MMTPDVSVGIIILGNSGVGKSFLGNVILGTEAFKHEYQADAVTTKTEYKTSSFCGQTYAIYNIPGLIEAEQERIELNKREINISFQQHPNAVVLYVFGTNNGRIQNEDVVAFNALNAAYPFNEKSLVVVINGVNPNRPNDYETKTTTILSSLLKMHLPHLSFVNHINQSGEKELLRQKLIEIVTSATPKIHQKVQEINLQAAEISKLTKEIAKFQKQIEGDREKHRLEIEKLKVEFEQREHQQKIEQAERERQIRVELDRQRLVQEERDRQHSAQQEEMRRTIQRQQQEIDRERKRQAEWERQQQAEKERQQQAERERQQQVERERQQQVERERQQQVERERQQQAERERQQQAERERQQQAERERQQQVDPWMELIANLNMARSRCLFLE